jgi:hypothetical protein
MGRTCFDGGNYAFGARDEGAQDSAVETLDPSPKILYRYPGESGSYFTIEHQSNTSYWWLC